MTQRDIVENYLQLVVQAIELCEGASHPSPCDDRDYLLEGIEGCVYRAGNSEGVFWTWKVPSDREVELIAAWLAENEPLW